MLIVDMSNLVFGTASDYYRRTKEQPDMKVFRAIVLNKLSAVKKKLQKFGPEVVIACDSLDGLWRRDVFPHYKAHRAQQKKDDAFDWKLCFRNFDALKEEMRENVPVKMIEVPGAEADDIIAILTQRFRSSQKIGIYSSDHDLLQLRESIHAPVHQFSIATNSFLTGEYSLFEHIVKGDAGDGIPNIKSPDDSLVTKTRQRPIRATDLSEWSKYGIEQPEMFCSDEAMLERFKQNRRLIDLSMIPHEIQMAIVDAYDQAKEPRGKVFNYVIANGLTKLMRDGF